MKSSEAPAVFQSRLGGLGPANITPADGVKAMFAFYRDERADDCDLDADGDMLLFQWGTHDWGDGEFFDLNITRQFMTGIEDEDIWQLSLTFRYAPTAELNDIGSGDRWCGLPSELEDFQTFVEGSSAFRTLKDVVAAQLDASFECVG